MKNKAKILTFIFSILFIGIFMVNHLYPYALDLDSVDKKNVSLVSELLPQPIDQSIQIKGKSSNVQIYADIEADIFQELIGEGSKGITNVISTTVLNNDANVYINTDIRTNTEQTVYGKNNIGCIQLLKIGITENKNNTKNVCEKQEF